MSVSSLAFASLEYLVSLPATIDHPREAVEMSIAKRATVIAGVPVAALTVAALPAHAASIQDLGDHNAATHWYFNGQVWIADGWSWGHAEVDYQQNDTVRWKIDGYKMYYRITGNTSYGPHNNDTYKIDHGYSTGVQSWSSPDSGTENTWIIRNPGTALTYMGQSHVHIVAIPDVPSDDDPHLDEYTVTW